jgi:hypothetical protein
MKAPAVLGLLVLLCATALAQERVYRCGPDGREYSQQPCAAGWAVDVSDDRSAAQHRDAVQIAARDIRLAQALIKERQQRESAASRQGAGHIGSSRGASAPDRARPKAPRKPDGRKLRDDANMTPPMKAFGQSG